MPPSLGPQRDQRQHHPPPHAPQRRLFAREPPPPDDSRDAEFKNLLREQLLGNSPDAAPDAIRFAALNIDGLPPSAHLAELEGVLDLLDADSLLLGDTQRSASNEASLECGLRRGAAVLSNAGWRHAHKHPQLKSGGGFP